MWCCERRPAIRATTARAALRIARTAERRRELSVEPQFTGDANALFCIHPGSGGNIGAETVLKATAGYTLLMVPSAVAANATLYKHLSFDFIRDSAPVAGVVRVPNVVEVNPLPSLPVRAWPAQ
jgi:tripartite-type tricarboxylate transporter receptor subunit TctC